jgi:hypothetical protein
MMKHLLEPPPPLHTVSPGISTELEAVVQRALEKKPEDRYAAADALLAAFHAAVSSSLPQPTLPPVLGIPPGTSPSAPVVQTTNSALLNNTQAAIAACQIDNCGVSAIGRCATCKRAFCGSHQAWSRGTRYIDQCAPCFAQTPEEVKRRKDAEIGAALDYIRYGKALAALSNSGVPSVDIQWVVKRWKQGRFGWGSRNIDTVVHRRGWILGEFCWQYTVSHLVDPKRNIAKTETVVENCLTALLDRYDAGSNRIWEGDGLVRVQYGSGGYEVLGFHDERYNISNRLFDGSGLGGYEEYIKVAQAVKRLVAASYPSETHPPTEEMRG